MRYQDIQLNESINYNWSKVIDTVKSYVLKHTQIDPDLRPVLQNLLMNTDDLHVTDEFDELSRSLRKFVQAPEFTGTLSANKFADADVYDSVSSCVTALGERVRDYFMDDQNFEPGYQAPKKLNPVLHPISNEQCEEILNACVPGIVEVLHKWDADMKAAQDTERQSKADGVAPEDFKAIVEAIVKCQHAAWAEYAHYLSTSKHVADGTEKVEVGGVQLDAPKPIGDGESLKTYVKSKIKPAQFLKACIDIVIDNPDEAVFPRELMGVYFAISAHKPARIKLAKAVQAKLST